MPREFVQANADLLTWIHGLLGRSRSMNTTLNQTLVAMGISVVAVLSGCSGSNNPNLDSTPEISTNQQASQLDDSKADLGEGKETASNQVKPGKPPEKPNNKDRLLERLDLVFDGVTLEEFAKTVAKRGNMTVWIRDNALAEIGLGRDTRITVNLKGVTLRTGLSFVLKSVGLAWDYNFSESCVVISTAEQLETDLSSRVYQVHGNVSREALSKNIQGTIDVRGWENVGGSGVLTLTISNGVVISQTAEFHRKITKTFAEFLRPVDPGASNVPREEWAAVIAALSSKTTLDVVDIPLADLLEQLGDEHQLKSVIDERTLNEVGLEGAAITSTANFKELSWRRVLELLLGDHGLTYTIDPEGEVLTITTFEGAEADAIPILYKVDDLDLNDLDYDILVNTIASNISPDNWDVAGGVGVIEVLPKQGVITISQTPRVHFKIAQLLADLRQLKK